MEYASTRLMSSWTMASTAAPSMVMMATMLTTLSTHGAASTKISNMRPIR